MHALLRFAVFIVAGACTLFWFIVARQSAADAIPLAHGARLALWTTLTVLLLVWPALILAICNVLLRLALALAVLGAAIYGTVFLIYLPMPSGPVPLLAAALVAVLAGTFWMFGTPLTPAAEASFETAKLRLAALYAAGLGTALWFSSFVPVMHADPRSDGFEAIPAFYGTIFFLVFVLPLLVMGLRGTVQRQQNAVKMLLGTVIVCTVLFGVPQLFS
jgi:hypothetical protein